MECAGLQEIRRRCGVEALEEVLVFRAKNEKNVDKSLKMLEEMYRYEEEEKS